MEIGLWIDWDGDKCGGSSILEEPIYSDCLNKLPEGANLSSFDCVSIMNTSVNSKYSGNRSDN